MCNKCFNVEIDSFPTEKYWLEFDLTLTKKLGRGEMKHFDTLPNGENIYECNHCNQLWILQDPDYSERGYFLKTN